MQSLLTLFVLVLFSLPVFSQIMPGPIRPIRPFPQLTDYLKLSEPQIRSILANNNSQQLFVLEKQRRALQVQREINEETARDVPDPTALGLRYAELEAICRELKERSDQLRQRNLSVLTAEQRTRFATLEAALKLMPVVAEAQGANLMAPSGMTPLAPSTGGIISGDFIGGLPRCGPPFTMPRLEIMPLDATDPAP